MKKKELKNLAKKIADAEYIIQNSDDAKAVAKAQDAILELSGKVSSVEDMLALDELVQEILNEKGIEIVQESEGSLSLFRETFNWSEPSPIQDANYIQPSYAEQ